MATPAVTNALNDAHRSEWAFVLSAAVRITRDLDLAEECVQDAYASALIAWERQGVPLRPGAWLTTAARNRALDAIRRESVRRRALPLLTVEPESPARNDMDAEEGLVDDRLRLIFTCCHPALSAEARVALTLRLVCGVATAEIARICLVGEATVAARITRAKRKIATARIPFRVPEADELEARTDTVLDVIHLLFTSGHTAPMGTTLVRDEVTGRALDLARMLHALLPENREASGLLALILLTQARSAERVNPDGTPRLLEHQDRARWDRRAIAEGSALVRGSLRGGRPGRYALLAAINAVHNTADSWQDTDWPQIVGLYDRLLSAWPSPVVELNRAVAIRFADGPAAGLAALDRLVADPRLAAYPYLAVARAECLRASDRSLEARMLYEQAIELTDNAVQRDFLQRQLQTLPG